MSKETEFAEEVEPLLRTGGEFEYLEDEELLQLTTIEDYSYSYESINEAIKELVENLHIDENTEKYLIKKYQTDKME